MLATNITPSISNSLSTNGCNCQSNQQVSTNDASRFSQLMGQNTRGIQGNRPPPPRGTESSDDFSSTQQGLESAQCQSAEGTDSLSNDGMQAQNGHPPPPPQDAESSSDLSELSSSEDLMSILGQLLSSLQSIDMSSLYDSDSSSLLSGTFDGFNDYFDQDTGYFS